MEEKWCGLCGLSTEAPGVLICGELICAECEQTLVSITAKDESYNFYRLALKRLLGNCFSEQEPGSAMSN